MKLKKNVVILIIIFSGFVFSVSFGTLYAQTHIIEGTACSCTLPIPILIPTFSSLGLLVGSIVYYLVSPKIEENGKKVEQVFAMLDMLEQDEREIIKKILENNGKITQSSLSRAFGKVKTFRILENLKMRGVIEKEAYGKTNMICLSEKFRKILNL